MQGFGGIEEGWAKFFIYNPTSYVMTKENVRFFQNKGFEEQKKKVFDPTKFDDKGPIDIPSRESFYAVLFPKQLYILGSRRDQLRQTVKVLELSSIAPSQTDQYCFNYNIHE